MKKTIFGCTLLIIGTQFLVNWQIDLLSGILYFIGMIYLLWGAVPEDKKQ